MSRTLRILLVAALLPSLAPHAGAALGDDVCVTVNLSKMPPSFSIVPCLPPLESSPPLPVKVWIDGIPLP